MTEESPQPVQARLFSDADAPPKYVCPPGYRVCNNRRCDFKETPLPLIMFHRDCTRRDGHRLDCIFCRNPKIKAAQAGYDQVSEERRQMRGVAELCRRLHAAGLSAVLDVAATPARVRIVRLDGRPLSFEPLPDDLVEKVRRERDLLTRYLSSTLLPEGG